MEQAALKTKLAIILAKIISIFLVIVSFWISFSPLNWGATGIVYASIMLIENTAFVSSMSPMAIFLVPLASKLMISSSGLFLALGYVAAVSGNLISYGMGRIAAQEKSVPTKKFNTFAVLGTYWHPQLASLTAFGAGVQKVPAARFVAISIPISAFYYLSIVVAILVAGGEITSAVSSDAFLIVVLVVWVLWDVAQVVSMLKARR